MRNKPMEVSLTLALVREMMRMVDFHLSLANVNRPFEKSNHPCRQILVASFSEKGLVAVSTVTSFLSDNCVLLFG